MPRTRLSLVTAALGGALALTVALGGCASPATPQARSRPTAAATSAGDCAGVYVTVQFGVLGAKDLRACAPADGTVTAAAALKAVGVTTSGTEKYGDQVVCRVNGRPSASKPFDAPGHPGYTETCAGMPAAFAYWAVWVRDSAKGKWGYAQNGIASEQLHPGQSLGLKFTTGSDTTPPRG
jgi:hypothetical protein